MALTITHAKVSTAGPAADPDKVGGDDWNDDHVLIGDYLRKATVTLSSADILSLHTTPVTLVPAPGAGKWLNVHRAVASMAFGTVAYTIADGVAVFVGTLIPADLTNSLTAGADRIETFEGQVTNFSPSVVENEALLITDAVADPTDGDGTLTVTVWYSIEDVPA